MSWTIGVDVGGTFTDFYGLHEASGEVWLHKRPSTPDDPGRAILEGVEAFTTEATRSGEDVRRLAHGTTVGTNALIQRKGGRVALVTTRGFRDLLEIGRQIRPHMYDLYADFPPPLVPRERRFEVGERILADGSVHRPLDPADLAEAVAAVRVSGAEACAICFLFGYLNPAHEQAVAERLRAALPDLHLSLSSEVQPEFREYERLSTTTLNAYLQPVMVRYLARLEATLAERLPTAEVGINQSSGGLMSLARARHLPIRTALSGPAAGVVGAVEIAATAGRPDVVTLDMGGTSADVALIRGGRAAIGFDRQVAAFPIRLPMVDIHTVGAGGGSIAWFDKDGLLKVGPQSASAVPGPACYGQGGQEPTVTDANLVLGRLAPRGLLGGRMALDSDAARAAILPLARRLGFTLERTARGLLGVVAANMVRAIRTISVERGHDPRRFTLMPFGGAGPLHAREVAKPLGIRRILVPAAPGLLCAQGLVVSDLKEDFVAGQRLPVEPAAEDAIRSLVDDLRRQAEAWLEREDVPRDARALELSLDLRYVGQNFELPVPFAVPALPDSAGMRAAFFAAHETAYGYHNPDDRVEVVNFRLTARGRLHRATPPGEADAHAPPPEPQEQRAVCFDAEEALVTPVYGRATLLPGNRLAGPAVIEQLDATTLLFPGDHATVDPAGNLTIELAP
ncbi:MAG TPA: hydantoinase/oxoprolinase family protein [Geminicoccaceae bacterium]|nr:hydantoinase/oxoprolinase family protein [Geminicoccaceae bacterium]